MKKQIRSIPGFSTVTSNKMFMPKMAALIIMGAALSAPQGANAALVVDFYRVLAPNAYGSPSYDQFFSNTQQAILNSQPSYGSGISEFKTIESVTGVQSYVTSYEQWNGAAAAGEGGSRPSWAYYIYDDQGANLDLTSLGGTKEYLYDWDSVEYSDWGAIALGNLDAKRLVGVDINGDIGIDASVDYVSYIGLSGNAWWQTNWTGTLGVDHVWTDYTNATNNPNRLDDLAQLGAWLPAHQSYWGFELVLGGQTFRAENIAVVPAPATVSLILLGLAGFAAQRRFEKKA